MVLEYPNIRVRAPEIKRYVGLLFPRQQNRLLTVRNLRTQPPLAHSGVGRQNLSMVWLSLYRNDKSVLC